MKRVKKQDAICNLGNIKKYNPDPRGRSSTETEGSTLLGARISIGFGKIRFKKQDNIYFLGNTKNRMLVPEGARPQRFGFESRDKSEETRHHLLVR
jgi:hypothetical protein